MITRVWYPEVPKVRDHRPAECARRIRHGGPDLAQGTGAAMPGRRRLEPYYRRAAVGRSSFAHVPGGPGKTAAVPSCQVHTCNLGTWCTPFFGLGFIR